MNAGLAAGRPDDTIFALASGAGRAAVSVLRVSGADTGMILQRLCGELPQPRRASLKRLFDASGLVLDRAVVLWMPGPTSYTGEDVAELHLHGGRAVLTAVTAALLTLSARPADPGEFTRRAFIAGRMGLLEAEAIADLVNAETEAQRLQALRQMSGSQSEMVAGWTTRLKRSLAFQEALIDFPDENLPADVEATLVADVAALLGELEAHAARVPLGERLRNGLVFAIVGAPNVGKSSLLNALAKRDIAIVSPLPGTTRDVLEVTVDLGGVPVTLIDTAGLRESEDIIEAEGVRRGRARAASADLILNVVDASSPEAAFETGLMIANKIDLAPSPGGVLGVSATTGEGLPALLECLVAEARRLTFSGADPILTRARHGAALRDAAAALRAALSCPLPELRGEEMRLAMQALGRLTGTVDVDAILDDVFSAFCIGK